MNLEEYRTVFAASSLVLMLIVASPALGLIVSFPSGTERFSEFWVLGPNHMAEDYPFDIRVNESYSVYVGVGNHLGEPSYYLVCVKFRNQTQPLPNVTASEPSMLPSLYEYRSFVVDEGVWESSLTFRVLEASCYSSTMFVKRLSINDVVFVVNSSTRLDSEYKGFYYQLFLELWLYDTTSQSFQYHNRFVGIWLNMTA